MMHVRGYHEYRRGCSIPTREVTILCNLNTVGDVMSTIEGVQYRGDTQITKDFSPTVLMISPHVHHDIPHGAQDNLHGTHYTHTVMSTPQYSRYPPHAS